MPEIERRYIEKSMVMADGVAITTAPIDMSIYAGGMVLIPTGWVAANLGFKISTDYAGTFTLLRDDTGVPVQISGIITDAAGWHKLPDDLFGAHWLHLWSKSATAATITEVNQTGGPLTFTVALKG